MPLAQKTIDIDVPPSLFYRLVTDFEAYPEFLEHVRSTNVLWKKGNEWEVEFNIFVIRHIEYTVRLVGDPGQLLSWTLTAGNLFRHNEGGWLLQDLGQDRTRVTFFIDVQLFAFVPRSITNRLIQFTLPKMLEQWAQRAYALQDRKSGGDTLRR